MKPRSNWNDGEKRRATCHERGDRYGSLNAEAMLFDDDGRPLVFTEPRRTLDGEWELCTLDGDKYIVSVGTN